MNQHHSLPNLPERAVQGLQFDPGLVRQVLVAFVREEIGKAGFSRAILGLSGGLDSALACVLAAEALGPENVLALRLPYRLSSRESLADAQTMIDFTGVQSETVDITGMVDGLAAVTPDITPHRLGNVMARTRMIVLYDRSAAWNGLVVGTSNKTELLLGYGTQFGDLASAVNPLGDLYKTQVRGLARFLGLPPAVLNKAPSADLWQGQTDEGDLGFTYEQVDALLYLLVDERNHLEEVIEAGFDPAFVDRVYRRMRTNHFKRLPPVIAKLGSRTIGHDFRYVRDWGV